MLSVLRDGYGVLGDPADGAWRAWGFEPWSWRGLAGVRRRVTLAKDALLGPVGACHVDDFVVCAREHGADWRTVFEGWRPRRDVMTHRFLFLTGGPPVRRKARSFWLGARGFLELYTFDERGVHPRVRDLADLLEQARLREPPREGG